MTAGVVLVNTCGFIQAAKQESIDELLAAAESGAKVAAVGCLAERYGAELADELPEAQVLSFDDYGDIARPAGRRAGRRPPPGAHSRATAASCCRSPRPSARTPRRPAEAGIVAGPDAPPGPPCPAGAGSGRPAGLGPACRRRVLRRRLPAAWSRR